MCGCWCVDDLSENSEGDNPAADIRGANGMPNWRSVLVRTGVFQDPSGSGNDAHDPADMVVDDVEAAIDNILRENQIQV